MSQLVGKLNFNFKFDIYQLYWISGAQDVNNKKVLVLIKHGQFISSAFDWGNGLAIGEKNEQKKCKYCKWWYSGGGYGLAAWVPCVACSDESMANSTSMVPPPDGSTIYVLTGKTIVPSSRVSASIIVTYKQ